MSTFLPPTDDVLVTTASGTVPRDPALQPGMSSWWPVGRRDALILQLLSCNTTMLGWDPEPSVHQEGLPGGTPKSGADLGSSTHEPEARGWGAPRSGC